MSDLPEALKAMTVKALRELARKQLGAGYSKLKTKSQLVAALAKVAVEKAAATPAAKAVPSAKAGRAPKATAKVAASPAGTPIPKPTLAPAATPKAPLALTAAPKAKAKPASAPVAPLYDEHLGELPDRYEDDAFIALPVDPATLFLYWDFNPKTTAAAASGLPAAHTVLSLHGDGRRVRELDVALESRSYYVRGLAPGHSYHAEIDFVGSDGRRQRVGRSTNVVGLPPSGPSPVVDDRFIAFPWEWKKGGRKLDSRPAPGAAQRDLAAGGWRAPSSVGPLRPWIPGGALSGRPVAK
jgi:hypothetical protein